MTLPQPTVTAARPWAFPKPRIGHLSNGIQIIIHQLPGQHVISTSLVLDLPLNAEPRDLEGIATICCRTLDEGTTTHPGEEFAAMLETEGAAFGIDVGLSGIQLAMDVPASRFGRAITLLAEAVREPELADGDIQRHVTLRLAEIEQAKANSSAEASIAFRQAVFDAGSRASRMSGGESDTVARIDPESVRSFHQNHIGPRGSTLIIGGDFTDDPLQLAEQAFGSWQHPGQHSADYQAPTRSARKMIIVDRPGAVQADLRFGGFGIDRSDPRWADIRAASYAMGGAFLSRLNAKLREEKGYTYGVGLQFAPMRTVGTFAVQGSFRTEVLADALAETRQLLDISSDPFTAEEIGNAVQFFTGVSPLQYATADGVVDQAAVQVLAELDPDYIDHSLAALRQVTAESATAAYTELVDLDAMSLVIVGAADQLAGPIRAAGFPDLKVIRPGGQC